MQLSLQQVTALAPDVKAAAAGKKLATTKHWRDLGSTAVALWGQCQGSALYQVKVELGQLAYNCTCPSRKLPCKHVLGLLMLAADSSAHFTASQPPDWVADWMAKRAASAEKRAAKQDAPAKPVDAAAQAKRAERREEKIDAGLDRLELWMDDLVRGGLAGLERKSAAAWEEEAKRLVDAQASGLANHVRRIGEIPGSGADWPRRLLMEIGRLALVTHAYRRADHLSDALRSDVRQLVGWTTSQEEMDAQGERVVDDWLFMSQEITDESRVRVQQNWLVGRESSRVALVLQFSAAGQPFPEAFTPGIECRAEVAFYPSAWPERAIVRERHSDAVPVKSPLPGHDSIADFLGAAAQACSRQPWLSRLFGVLQNVRPRPAHSAECPWQLIDQRGHALPLAGPRRIELLARSGGHPVDVAGIWTVGDFRPLGIDDGTGYVPFN